MIVAFVKRVAVLLESPDVCSSGADVGILSDLMVVQEEAPLPLFCRLCADIKIFFSGRLAGAVGAEVDFVEPVSGVAGGGSAGAGGRK